MGNVTRVHQVNGNPSPDIADVITLCPLLTENDFKVTSPKDKKYNCMAWAAMRDKMNWWEPRKEAGCCWPKGAPFDVGYQSFIKVFELLGYVKCETPDLEEGFEKVAVFKDLFNWFSHASHQREDGTWTSKLGPFQDIQHWGNEKVQTFDYGDVIEILKRPRQIWGDGNPRLPPNVELEFF